MLNCSAASCPMVNWPYVGCSELAMASQLWQVVPFLARRAASPPPSVVMAPPATTCEQRRESEVELRLAAQLAGGSREAECPGPTMPQAMGQAKGYRWRARGPLAVENCWGRGCGGGKLAVNWLRRWLLTYLYSCFLSSI